MHDHATDGGIADYHDKASAREVRLHLDNSHDLRTAGWTYKRLVERHWAFHVEEAERLAKIEAAANLVAEGLATVPAAVAESILGESPYLTDTLTGTVYLAEQVDPRHMPAAGQLFRLTAQVPPAERVVDLLEATKASLAATRAYLDAHKDSEDPIPSDAPGGGPVPPAVDLSAPPSSEGTEPRPAGRTVPSGAPSPVVDLMEALEASLAAVKADRGGKA